MKCLKVAAGKKKKGVMLSMGPGVQKVTVNFRYWRTRLRLRRRGAQQVPGRPVCRLAASEVPAPSCSTVNFSLLALLRLCKKLDPFDEFYYYHEIYVFVVGESCSVVSDSLRPHGLYSPWNSPGQNTGVGSLSLLGGDIPKPRDRTQVSRMAGRFFTS